MANELAIWTYDIGDGDYFIAESGEEAEEMMATHMGEDCVQDAKECCGDSFAWVKWPADKEFEFSDEEDLDEHGDIRIQRQLPSYFIQKFGKGYFASSNY